MSPIFALGLKPPLTRTRRSPSRCLTTRGPITEPVLAYLVFTYACSAKFTASTLVSFHEPSRHHWRAPHLTGLPSIPTRPFPRSPGSREPPARLIGGADRCAVFDAPSHLAPPNFKPLGVLIAAGPRASPRLPAAQEGGVTCHSFKTSKAFLFWNDFESAAPFAELLRTLSRAAAGHSAGA